MVPLTRPEQRYSQELLLWQVQCEGGELDLDGHAGNRAVRELRRRAPGELENDLTLGRK